MISHSKFVLAISSVLLLMCAGAVFSQSDIFTDPAIEYTFQIPDATWKVLPRGAGSNSAVELVFSDRRIAALEVRKTSATSSSPIAELIQDDEQKKQFLPGYVAGKQESFVGKYKGTVFNFEYVQAGRPMAGRYYYLRAGDGSVYVLRFSGDRERLRVIRNQTDAMARTFALKS